MLKSLTLFMLFSVSVSVVAKESIGTIYVHSTKSNNSLQNTPAAVSVITSDELEDKRPNSVEELVQTLPGVHASFGPREGAQQINIRGIDSTKIFFTIDGARQNFRGSHDADFLLNLSLLKSVEVIKGPASTLYGSGAVGGVVTFETKKARDLLAKDEAFGMSFETIYGSANNYQKAILTTYALFGKWEGLLSVSLDEKNSLRLGDNTKLPYSESEGRDFFIKLNSNKEQKHQVEVIAQKMITKAQEPQNGRTSVSSRNPLTDRDSQKDALTLRYNLQSNNSLIDPYGNLHYTKTNIEKYDYSVKKLARTTVETRGVDLYNISTISKELSLTYGLEYIRDDNEGRNGSDKYAPFPDGKSEFYGTYLQASWQAFSKLQVVSGLRFDKFELSSKDQNLKKEGDKLTKKLAINSELTSNLSVYANYGEGYNAPRLQDLFVNGLHFPGSGGIPNNYFVANSNLVPEQTKSYEVGMKLAKDEFVLSEDSAFMEVTYFQTEAKNFIEQVVNISGGTTTFENRANVDFDGIELKGQYDFFTSSISLTYAQTRSKNKSTKAPLDTTAADEWNFVFSHLFEGLDLKLRYHVLLAEKQKRVATASKASDGYNVHNLGFSWTPSQAMLKNFEASFTANNIFDRDYRPHTALLKSSGRDFILDLRYRF